MVTDNSTDDPFLPLAFSLHSNPGAFAVLAGAGVSRGANLPTAWDIVVDLGKRICRSTDQSDTDPDTLTPDNVEEWYTDTFHRPLTYSGVLEHVAPTPYERESVLRSFFELEDPAEEESFGPSAAHFAVADLMAAGVVRVVVTMNFDHLFEDALRARHHIEPVIVSTDAVAKGLAPLHTIEHCIVHLHGDYRDAASMLNTSDELGGYQPHMRELVEKIVANYGLVVAGWSAEHDHALREIVQSNYRPYFTPAWIAPRSLNETAGTLATAIKARVIAATADSAFPRLADAVSTLARRQDRDPLAAAVVTDRIKRDLAGRHPAITAHDTFTSEVARLEDLPELLLVDFPNDDPRPKADIYYDFMQRIDAACRVPVSAVAALAYWGSDVTDDWWLATIEQWAHTHDSSGATYILQLPLTVAVRLYYAAGIAATAAKRYELLSRIFAIPAAVITTSRVTILSSRSLDWNRLHPEVAPVVTDDMRQRLATDLVAAIAVSPTRLDTAWQEFETLRTAAQILLSPDFTETLIHEVDSAEFDLESRKDEPGTEATKKSFEQADRLRAKVARLARTSRPHVHVVSEYNIDGDKWVSEVAYRTSYTPACRAALLPLVAHLTATEQQKAVTIALRGARTFFHLCGSTLEWDHTSVGHAEFMPSRLWLDEVPGLSGA